MLAGVDLTGSICEAAEHVSHNNLARKLSLFLDMIKRLVEGSANGTTPEPFILRLHLFEGVTTAPAGVGI